MRHNSIVFTAYLVWFRPFCLHPHWLLISCPSTYSVVWCPLCVVPHRLAHGIVRVSSAWLMAPSSFRRRSLVCSARGTVCLYVQLSAPVHSYAGFGLAVHAVCWTWPPFALVCFAACSARGTVSWYVQLSASMHSYAGFGRAVHAACWTWPSFTLRMPRSVLGSRHRQLSVLS